MSLEILKRKTSDNYNRTQSLTKEVSTESVIMKKVSKLLNTQKKLHGKYYECDNQKAHQIRWNLI